MKTVRLILQKWKNLFKADLSDAIDPKEIWTYEDGVLTASEDINIWTEKEYKNVMIDLEFKTYEAAEEVATVLKAEIIDTNIAKVA